MSSKQNLKRYLEFKKISPAQFYRDTGLSNGFLNQGDNISSNNIEIIISNYPDLNLFWLITGRGDMLNTSNDDHKNREVNREVNREASSNPYENNNEIKPNNNPTQKEQNNHCTDIISNLVDRIGELSEEIGALKKENHDLKHRLEDASDALNANNVPA